LQKKKRRDGLLASVESNALKQYWQGAEISENLLVGE